MEKQEAYQTNTDAPGELEKYFQQFRRSIIGDELLFENEHGTHKVIYADWIASGRLYRPIEEALMGGVGNVVANPHSYSSYTGASITALYQLSRQNIKRHVNADHEDILVTIGSGMSDALIRFQDILGLKYRSQEDEQRPVVFITHMEHHSNHVSWMECAVDVVIVPPGDGDLVDVNKLRTELEKYKDRKVKIGAFSACSNVTGIINPIHELARVMHEYNGYCLADYAASAPYVAINMHPDDPETALDAVYFSPHKFLGGPGSCGILLFDKKFHTGTPKIPGGGNVRWTDPWGGYGYTKDIEAQEDGGTPAFLQTIKASMAISLKEKMGISKMKKREQELLQLGLERLRAIGGAKILGDDYTGERIGVLAFNVSCLHYNLVVKILNDRYGIQARGGWSCASTYAHCLYAIDETESGKIMSEIDDYDSTHKPGWVRLSLHPTMTNGELEYCMRAVKEISTRGSEWARDFRYNPKTNEFDRAHGEESIDGDLERLLFDF
ncbi:aminotransferase class V-fold PLP-dependent enzyme [Fulvivirga sp. M361]|uniref:aminotransferase class V-fold PLP-dependent enzyme n=1 Tax=Fulvivirga sp. M361 TaxID=2594266 RepID=UPI00117AC9BC|nr:aminotransferase class V-fold PLP-dependent enzyme [Fulvivirga sp. M361]TRX59963.1 aminotransferase class V-fold PLP-dependent enzyme [Fulvivirga sp. M361]